MLLWSFAALGAGIYCIIRGVGDIRQKRYAWGALALVSAAIFLLMPLQTHAVRVDLPVPASR